MTNSQQPDSTFNRKKHTQLPHFNETDEETAQKLRLDRYRLIFQAEYLRHQLSRHRH